MDETTVTAITSAVDFSAIITGIGTVAIAIIAVVLAIKGGKILIGAVRGS